MDFNATIVDKLRLLESNHEKRLFVFGGSNVALGLDSELIERQTGFKVANIGLQIAVGLPLLLKMMQSHWRERDVLVLSPEYRLFYQEPQVPGHVLFAAKSPEVIFLSLAADPSILLGRKFMDNSLTYLGSLVQTAFRYHMGTLDDVALYGRRSMTPRGDVTDIWDKHGTEKLEYIDLQDFEGTQQLEPGVALFKRFLADARDAKVTVYLSYPPISRTFYETKRAAIEEIDTYLRAQLGEQLFLHECAANVYPDIEFHDSPYHPLRKAVRARSALMASEVNKRQVASRRDLLGSANEATAN